MLDTYEKILGMQDVQKLKVVPMSANTIKHRIEDMTEDITIQLDESSDITNTALE